MIFMEKDELIWKGGDTVPNLRQDRNMWKGDRLQADHDGEPDNIPGDGPGKGN